MQEAHNMAQKFSVRHREKAGNIVQCMCICVHENGSDMTQNSLITYAKEST